MNHHPDLPYPKYRVGQKVFYATSTWSRTQITCPACKGNPHVEVEAFGKKQLLPCPTCRGGGCVDQYGHKDVKPRALTVGSIRIDTSEAEEDKISYMCEETGLGSGRVYSENTLFPDDFVAMVYAKMLAGKAQEAYEKENEQDEHGVWHRRK